MLTVIKSLAKQLNEAGIIWALGGSLVMKYHGIVSDVHDIDILVVKEDFQKVHTILNSIGETQPIIPNTMYKTSFIQKYTIDGVSVDLMSEFKIDNGGLYTYPFNMKSISEIERMEGIEIHYTSLEDWLVLYWLMNRKDSIQRIKQYFTKHKTLNKIRIEQACIGVPGKIKQDITTWLDSHMKGEASI